MDVALSKRRYRPILTGYKIVPMTRSAITGCSSMVKILASVYAMALRERRLWHSSISIQNGACTKCCRCEGRTVTVSVLWPDGFLCGVKCHDTLCGLYNLFAQCRWFQHF